MTLTQLEYIVSIADSGSFVEAANKCFVTQPALTTQVKNLERELDVIIFDRTRKPIIPTEIGLTIIEQARQIVSEARKLPDLVSEFNNEVKGDLSFGIIPTISPYLVPLFINSFNKTHTDINLHVREEITEEIVHKLKNGELDAGILATPIDVKGLTIIPLYYERFYVYVSPDHPAYYKDKLSSKDLNANELWLLKEGNCFRNQVINICSDRFEPEFIDHFRYESHSIESLKRIVEVRKGMTLIPELALGDLPKSKREMVKEIEDINPYREVSLVVTKPFLKRRFIEKLKYVLLENIPAEMRIQPKGILVDTHVSI